MLGYMLCMSESLSLANFCFVLKIKTTLSSRTVKLHYATGVTRVVNCFRFCSLWFCVITWTFVFVAKKLMVLKRGLVGLIDGVSRL